MPTSSPSSREYGRRWIRLVNRLGGTHHGYFLPSEGDSDEAFALFTFPSLAAYEEYRHGRADDPECIEAYQVRDRDEVHPAVRAPVPLAPVRVSGAGGPTTKRRLPDQSRMTTPVMADAAASTSAITMSTTCTV